jgi:hypothetical protein
LIGLKVRTHPNVLFAYSANHVEIILRVENRGKEPVWCEADLKVPEKISLSPTGELSRGRVRLGILKKKEFMEKATRVFANNYTNPQVYRVVVTLYMFNKDGVIETRLEKPIDIRCELKKEETL